MNTKQIFGQFILTFLILIANPYLRLLPSASGQDTQADQVVPVIQEEEYKEIKKYGEEILELCPPENCLVIGIGRSPTPITTYLKLEQKNYAWNIPLSAFRYGTVGPELNDSQKADLKEHFDRFLPGKKEIKGRNILVIDFSLNGGSLAAARNHIQDYYAHQAKGTLSEGPKFQTLALNNGSSKIQKDFDITHVRFLSDGPLQDNLNKQKYDAWAEYNRFDLQKDKSGDHLKNGQYRVFYKAMKKMKKDDEKMVNANTTKCSSPSWDSSLAQISAYYWNKYRDKDKDKDKDKGK